MSNKKFKNTLSNTIISLLVVIFLIVILWGIKHLMYTPSKQTQLNEELLIKDKKFKPHYGFIQTVITVKNNLTRLT
ncbi:hypothetical protein [Thalassotalea piscium]|uniref:Uncharacterized protein n=1 Tax=Thalassotalea piscium TaxID=1230533 RepID=A0A7X0TTH4_9GAMM|nr:hypothetical protein [Thalassotalea piscium]MBB6543090.1 hypothetical protein [Thalassotalea piscium]